MAVSLLSGSSYISVILQLFSKLTAKEATACVAAQFMIQAGTIKKDGNGNDIFVWYASVVFDFLASNCVDNSWGTA